MWDEWLHFAAYAGLALALAYATGSTASSRSYVQVISIFAVTVAYGAGIEAAQWFLPARHPSTLDALANAFGALAIVPWAVMESRLDYVPVRRDP